MKSLKLDRLHVSSLQVGASSEFESLDGNPAWKFERTLREGARRRTAGERVGAHRAALRLEFESLKSLDFESLKPREFYSLKVRKLQFFERSKSFKLWGVESLKCPNFEGLKIERRGVRMLEIFQV